MFIRSSSRTSLELSARKRSSARAQGVEMVKTLLVAAVAMTGFATVPGFAEDAPNPEEKPVMQRHITHHHDMMRRGAMRHHHHPHTMKKTEEKKM
jgi:hypothetical protein